MTTEKYSLFWFKRTHKVGDLWASCWTKHPDQDYWLKVIAVGSSDGVAAVISFSGDELKRCKELRSRKELMKDKYRSARACLVDVVECRINSQFRAMLKDK